MRAAANPAFFAIVPDASSLEATRIGTAAFGFTLRAVLLAQMRRRRAEPPLP